MLTYDKLVKLERSLHETRTLSVYLDGTATDPSGRPAWPALLDEAIARTRASLRAATPRERECFARCVDALSARLRADAALHAPGFVAFVTPHGVRYAASLPVAVPTVVEWGTGACVLPALGALRELRPVLVATLDGGAARLNRWVAGELEDLGSISPDAAPARAGADEPSALREALAARLEALAGDEGWVVIAGARPAALAALASLPEALAGRATLTTALRAGASPAEIPGAAVWGMTVLRRVRELTGVVEVLERCALDSRGVLGFVPTLEALRERAVRELYITPRAVERRGEAVEDAVERAFAYGARVELVDEEAARRLDATGEGIGATLRFLPWTPVSSEAVASAMAGAL